MSRELLSAVRGSGVGMIIGLGFGILTLSTIGFDRITLFEGLLLLACSMFGGVLFGSLIGASGGFRRESPPAVESARKAVA